MAIEVISIEEKSRRPRVKRIRQAGQALKLIAAARKRRLILRSILASLVLLIVASTIFFIHSYNYYARIVDARLKNGYLTSRAGIYAAPRTLRAGQTLSLDRLVELLRRAGYLETSASDVWSGSFTTHDDSVEIHPRRATAASPDVVRVRFDKKGHISDLTGDMGVTLDAYTLEPEILTTDAAMKTGQRAQLSYKEIPPTLAHAILSIEDRRFFEHGGVDIWGVGRALWRNTTDDETSQGGSTITQQLVKNTFLTPERTFRRKFAEAMTAFALERRMSKEDIFALYCNEIYLGQRGAVSVRGVEQAAHIYFGKELKDLTLAESATIAGMIQSPNRYAPDRHPDTATARRNTVLGTMVRDQFITREEAQVAALEPVSVAPLNDTDGSTAPYFIDYVNRLVEAKLGAEAKTDERGARIYTTIDLDLQQLAEAAIKRQLERLDKVYKNRDQKPQAALVALDPKTGNVLAMVGGRNYAESQLNRATDARRQPGSVFKPIVYSAALESGLSPLTMYQDAPHEFTYAGGAKYRPTNYGGGFSMRDVMMRNALVHSLNVVTVDVAMQTGLTRVERTAEAFGLPKAEPYPALALGTTEATPLMVAAAYTTFANNGERVEPNLIARVTDSSGTDIISEIPQKRPVIRPTTSYMITDMLMDVIDKGTAHAARGAVKNTAIAGKTGTSRDGWFVGYTPNLVVAVWIGFDDNKQLGLTGAEAALPAWTEFVKNAVELRPDLGGEAFERPAGITFVEIDPETGLLATASCPQHEQVAITSTLAPNLECATHGETFEMVGSTEGSEVYDYEPASIEANDSRVVTRGASTRPQQLPRPSVSVERLDAPARQTTRVETDTRGQRTLVNEMRVNSRRSSLYESRQQ
ncbi:MAG: penicillin-binding protein [Acidobacteriota bacterium]|jgi:penicillin-binding protein 1B|nr:penicillin-binding protein [Acidobacteriota bacterium]